MKNLNLTPLPDTPAGMTPREIIVTVLSVDVNGMLVTELRRRMHILDRIEHATEALGLEDAEYSTLQSAFANFKFSLANKYILHACDVVETATS